MDESTFPGAGDERPEPAAVTGQCMAIELPILRTIAWRTWDPLGLNDNQDGSSANHPADDYDSYVARVARGLCEGEPKAELANYLVGIEAYHMGISIRPDSRTRAHETVAAISDYLDQLR